MRQHALLSASGASRWMTCTPSARLEEKHKQTESAYADEGTLAHELAEWRVKEIAWGVDCSKPIAKIKAHPLYAEEMYGYCTDFAEYVVQKVKEAEPGAILVQEQLLRLTKYIPEGFGTTDICIAGPKYLDVIDFKYGKGVFVDAYENSQLMVYGLGALEDYDLIYDIDVVRLTVYQPRMDNIDTYEITADNLRRWGQEVVRPAALLAFQGVGDFIPGSHCKFCRVKASCKAHAAMNLQIAAREFDPPTLSDEQIVKILGKAGQIKNWVNSVENYALKQSLIHGKKWPGLKLVEGRSVRKIKDEAALTQKLEEEGYEMEQYMNSKMKGLTELKALLGKKKFEELVEPLLVKPPGKPTLVDEDDKRPALNSTESAALEFDDFDDE